MLYKKDGQLFSRAAAIADILKQLDTVVQPAYIDDKTLSLYGFYPDTSSLATVSQVPTKEQRKLALASVDWVINATQISDQTKASVEAWRWIVRNLPQISASADIPPLPEVHKKVGDLQGTVLTESEINTIKNYVTKDTGWITFLQVWKDLNFTYLKETIANLLIAYTNVTIDEIIGSV
jgi:hypothetical protein